MSRVLVVADDPWVVGDVHAALSIGANELIDHSDPSTAAEAAGDKSIDVAVVDLQLASMGGMAITRSIRDLEDPVPVVLLLDREADTFLAGRSGATAWVVKPFTASSLRTAVSDASGDA
jgi:DNA-binding response OmpR family regulator